MFARRGATNEHDLEHDFCTEGTAKTARFRAQFLHGGEHQNSTIYSTIFARRGTPKQHDLEHDFCTEGSTKEHDLEQDFLHGGGHQRARSRSRLSAWSRTIFTEPTPKRSKKHDLEHDFCTEENTKEHDLEHDFCTEGSTQTARFTARFLHGGEHQYSTI